MRCWRESVGAVRKTIRDSGQLKGMSGEGSGQTGECKRDRGCGSNFFAQLLKGWVGEQGKGKKPRWKCEMRF